MSANPFGPLSREEFAKCVDAPYGRSHDAIRTHDPLYGRSQGEKIKWRVRFVRQIEEEGFVTVEAASEDEASEIAANIDDKHISWDVVPTWYEAGDIDSVEPI